MLDTKTPTAPLFRLGRKPDPWIPPDWSRAQPDGTFGNRFDDPQGNYRVLYAATQRVSCFVETLARFRPDLALIAELQAIAGEDDYVPLGAVPSDWYEPRVMGEATVTGEYADLYGASWVSHLRQVLAADCIALGLVDLDDSVLQQGEPRRLTQLASLKVNEAGLDGIYYRSRYGHDLENWALFEPFEISSPKASLEIRPDDVDLQLACRLLGLKIDRK
jgi:RES domain